MQNVLIQITTQMYENYGLSEGKFHWKPKGGHVFTMKVDSNLFMADRDKINSALSKLVATHNNQAEKFEFVDYEMIFHEPTVLDAEKFAELLRAEYDLELVDNQGNETVLGKIVSEEDYELDEL